MLFFHLSLSTDRNPSFILNGDEQHTELADVLDLGLFETDGDQDRLGCGC